MFKDEFETFSKMHTGISVYPCYCVRVTVSAVSTKTEAHTVSSDKCGETTNLWLHSLSAVLLTDRNTIFSYVNSTNWLTLTGKQRKVG